MSAFYDDNFEQELYFIRHPKTVVGHSVCYGATDYDVVDDVLEETTVDVLKKSNGWIPDKCYSSPLVRSKKLAECLFDTQEVHLAEAVREISFGTWEGLAWDKIPEDAQKRWGEDVLSFNEHGGENFYDLQNRVIPFWENLLKSDDRKIAVVAHAGVIVALVSYLLNADPAKVFMLDIPFGGVVKIQKKWENYFKIKIV